MRLARGPASVGRQHESAEQQVVIAGRSPLVGGRGDDARGAGSAGLDSPYQRHAKHEQHRDRRYHEEPDRRQPGEHKTTHYSRVTCLRVGANSRVANRRADPAARTADEYPKDQGPWSDGREQPDTEQRASDGEPQQRSFTE